MATINVLLSTFPGLGLPSTLCIPISSTSTISDFSYVLSSRLPPDALNHRLIFTTSSNKQFSLSSPQPLTTLLPNANDTLLPLRISLPLCGGKGGFGSQLRAAGGRMSSKKKRSQNAAEANASSRNLDGRRLRTVTEAKALAEYLAVKPEMDKREKEERKKRWEAVVEAAERQKEDLQDGKGKGRVDGKWLEEKEEAEQKTREAVIAAMKAGMLIGVGGLSTTQEEALVGSVGSAGSKESASNEEDDDDEDMSNEDDAGEGSSSSKATTPPSGSERKIFGWDDDDDDEEDDEEEKK